MDNIRYWFTGDLHLGHKNILDICKRPFSTIEEHDRTMIGNHNSLVRDEDITYNFGDVGYKCEPKYMSDMIRQMKGRLVIILGNHDKALRTALRLGFLDKEVQNGKLEIAGGYDAVWDDTLDISKRIEINGQRIFISHYGHRTWPTAFRGAWHLYAHSHGNLPSLYKSIDVGVDAVSNKYFPISFEEVSKIMASKNEDFSEK